MKWFNNMKIVAKMITGFVIVALFSCVVGLIGMMSIKSINEDSSILYKNMTVPMSKIGQISTVFQRARVTTRDIISANSAEDIEKNAQTIQGYRKQVSELSKDVEKLLISDELKGAFEKFIITRTAYGAHLDKLVELARANKDEEATNLLNGDMRKSADAEMAEIDKMVELIINKANELGESNNKTATASSVQMSILIAICLIISMTIGIIISKTIGGQIKKVVFAAELIADGDLNVNVDINSKDEIGVLAGAFNKMSANINRIMTDINISAENVASGSRQVSESSLALSQGATEQASAVQELTASLEEISAQTQNNAQSASNANELAESARLNASQGNNQMSEMLKAMDQINDSSNNISKIIKVIDEIAFQTNILALNAAVEAARAGQHGKGFAVVAEEVRNLAARSAKAAKETTEMIEGSIINVSGGTKIANNTADALNKIVGQVEKVANLVGSIATASNEQALGISQVNQGIMQVSNVIQTNSATSEESAAASGELSKQAQKLKNLIMEFKLRTTSSGAASQAISTAKKENFKTEAQLKKISLSDKEFAKY